MAQAHDAAKLEQAALLAQLSTQHSGEKPSALDRAMAVLNGTAPSQRQDTAGLHSRLAEVNDSMALLGAAISEQRDAMTGLVGEQSAVVNAAAKPAHLKAAQAVKAALAGLSDAMQAEQSLRDEITAAGYQCTLEPLVRPELTFSDSQSVVSRFKTDVESYLTLNELAGAKSVNVRLLFGAGDAMPGDVLTLSGPEAAALVRVGHAEVTTAKPSRVNRPVLESYGQSISNAFGA